MRELGLYIYTDTWSVLLLQALQWSGHPGAPLSQRYHTDKQPVTRPTPHWGALKGKDRVFHLRIPGQRAERGRYSTSICGRQTCGWARKPLGCRLTWVAGISLKGTWPLASSQAAIPTL